MVEPTARTGLSGAMVRAERTGVVVAGILIVSPIKVTSVCPKALPFKIALFCRAIVEAPGPAKIFPSKVELGLSVVVPATAQKMFPACAPPLNKTFLLVLRSRFPGIWNIQTPVVFPDRVTSPEIFTLPGPLKV